jgi:hypothetical protein
MGLPITVPPRSFAAAAAMRGALKGLDFLARLPYNKK